MVVDHCIHTPFPQDFPPAISLKLFVARQFSTKINLRLIWQMSLIQVAVIAVAILFLSYSGDSTGLAVSVPGVGMVLVAFGNEAIRGPLGEELGWRGFALSHLQRRYSPLVSALIVGLLWGLWHTPIWFTSGYAGIDLVIYILLFMAGIVSFSVFVTLFYNLNQNLVIPVIAHQLFNFLLVFAAADTLQILRYVMPAYVVAALAVIVINPRRVLHRKQFRHPPDTATGSQPP